MSMAEVNTQCDLATLSGSVVGGSILDASGFLKYAADQSAANEILNGLSVSGIKHFVCLDFKRWYPEDVAEFYANGQVSSDGIHSRVHGRDVVVSEDDLRLHLKLPPFVQSDLSMHQFNGQEFWNRIRGENSPPNSSLYCQKSQLKVEFARLADIIHRIISMKVGSTGEVKRENVKLMSAILSGFTFNWAFFIFNAICSFVSKCKPMQPNGLFKQKVGYGFLLGFILKEKGVLMRGGKIIHPNCYMFRNKPKGHSITETMATIPEHNRISSLPARKKKTRFSDRRMDVEEPLAKRRKLKKNKRCVSNPNTVGDEFGNGQYFEVAVAVEDCAFGRPRFDQAVSHISKYSHVPVHLLIA